MISQSWQKYCNISTITLHCSRRMVAAYFNWKYNSRMGKNKTHVSFLWFISRLRIFFLEILILRRPEIRHFSLFCIAPWIERQAEERSARVGKKDHQTAALWRANFPPQLPPDYDSKLTLPNHSPCKLPNHFTYICLSFTPPCFNYDTKPWLSSF